MRRETAGAYLKVPGRAIGEACHPPAAINTGHSAVHRPGKTASRVSTDFGVGLPIPAGCPQGRAGAPTAVPASRIELARGRNAMAIWQALSINTDSQPGTPAFGAS